jgi:hypothetical protein
VFLRSTYERVDFTTVYFCVFTLITFTFYSVIFPEIFLQDCVLPVVLVVLCFLAHQVVPKMKDDFTIKYKYYLISFRLLELSSLKNSLVLSKRMRKE